MNIYVAASLFGILVLLYWIISEAFTVFFRLIGLPDEKARFQVVSLLTGCGFTTRESEMILTTRSRRRLARVTMLFGYIFNVTIVSALVNIFVSLKANELGNTVLSMLIPLMMVALVLVLSKTKRAKQWIDHLVEQAAGRISGAEDVNSILLIDHIGGASIAQVTLKTIPEYLKDIPLAQTGLKQEWNILVLLVEQKGKKASAALARTVFQPGDRLTVFGDYYQICTAFEARERFTGD